MAENTQYKNDLIFSINTKTTFMKAKPCFNIEKVLFSFVSFDEAAEAGSKIKDNVDFYMSIDDALYLSWLITEGHLTKMIKKEAAKGEKYPKAVYTRQGGIQADKCKEKGIRTDDAALARVLSITPGSKQPYVFKIEQGPGRETPEGLIVPTWKGKAEVVMYIPCDEVTLRTFGLKLDAVVRAHLAAKEVEDMLAKRAEERARAKSKKVA